MLLAIDDFFNRNPFFVAGCTFIWLIVIPLTDEFFLRKYRFISAIDAFRKLRDDPNVQLLDIMDNKTVKYLRSPNLKILNKGVVQVQYSEGDEDGFVKKFLQSFGMCQVLWSVFWTSKCQNFIFKVTRILEKQDVWIFWEDNTQLRP